MTSHFQLIMLHERVVDMARVAEQQRAVHTARREGRAEAAEEEKSKAGWLDRRPERQRRTGDSPEKIAERRRRRDPTPGENATRAGWAGFLGGGG